MSPYVTDTHALHWHLVGNTKLSATVFHVPSFRKCLTLKLYMEV